MGAQEVGPGTDASPQHIQKQGVVYIVTTSITSSA